MRSGSVRGRGAGNHFTPGPARPRTSPAGGVVGPGHREREPAGRRVQRWERIPPASETGWTMPRALGLLLALPLLASAAAGQPADQFPDYRPVPWWPRLPAGLELGPVSAVA